ncbi:MAG: hypothetical protein M1815_005643 [Lichina confinis]|nr:MAG: hypothetical protein M1815_005643 [Lichina confinis]
MSTKPVVLSIYRRALKLTLAWTIERGLWRGQALYIRSLFEAKKDVREPRQLKVSVKAPTRNVAARLILYLQALILEAEDLLDKWKHPEPYRPPTAPGGSKYERNIPPPILDPPPPMKL